MPGFLKDEDNILEEVTQCVNSCRRADDIVGEILEVLDEKGKRENTIVLFLSDNGMPFKSAKFETYFESTLTPLIVRWLGRIQANTVNNTHYVSGIDIMPTLLHAAGVIIPSDLDGRSFLNLLEGDDAEIGDRDKVVTAHFETVAYVSEGTSIWDRSLERGYVVYNNRQLTRPRNLSCIQSNDYGYIFNATDTGFNRDGPSNTLEAIAGLSDNQWWDHRQRFLNRRGSEEFYNFAVDPNGLNNLIDDPDYAELISQFREDLMKWMIDIRDPSRFEYQHLIEETTPETYLAFAQLTDGQTIPLEDDILNNVELEYIMLDYVKELSLLVNDQSHQDFIRAPFDFDLSDLNKGNYTLRLRMRSGSGDETFSDEIIITIGDEAPPIDWTADSDGDGRSNLLEFVQGTDKETTDQSFSQTVVRSGDQLKIVIQERRDLKDVSRTLQKSDRLSSDSWTTINPATVYILETNGTLREVELKTPDINGDQQFYRILYKK